MSRGNGNKFYRDWSVGEKGKNNEEHIKRFEEIGGLIGNRKEEND
jgi:hypothetical protein